MSCSRDAEHCNQIAGSSGAPEATATWASGRGSAEHCDVCGGFLTRAGVCNQPHTMTMSLAGGAVLGAVGIDTNRICPTCGADLSVDSGEEDWCIECEDMVTVVTDELAGHIRALSDDDSLDVRRSATWGLGKIGDAKAIPTLEKTLTDDDSFGVRQHVAIVLGEIGDPSTIPALMEVLSDDKNTDVHWSAAWALDKIGDAKAIPVIEKALSDEDPDVRWSAAIALSVKGNRPSVGVQTLKDMSCLPLFLALNALDGCPQDPRYHPEGDALAHTGQVCDAMAAICERESIEGDRRFKLMLAAMCHDLGKPETTVAQARALHRQTIRIIRMLLKPSLSR